MSKKPPRRPKGVNQLAASIVGHAASDGEPKPEKNPAAVALGRLGGKKGGPARAAALSAKKRSEIAKKAARARWKSEHDADQRSGASDQ